VTLRNVGDVSVNNIVLKTDLDDSWSATIPLLAVGTSVSERFSYTVPDGADHEDEIEFVFSAKDGTGETKETPLTSQNTAYVYIPASQRTTSSSSTSGGVESVSGSSVTGSVLLSTSGSSSSIGTLSNVSSTLSNEPPVVGDVRDIPATGRTLDGAPQLGLASDQPTTTETVPTETVTQPNDVSLPTNPYNPIPPVGGGDSGFSAGGGDSGPGGTTLPKTGSNDWIFGFVPVVVVLVLSVAVKFGFVRGGSK
jgi:hypothetical protein